MFSPACNGSVGVTIEQQRVRKTTPVARHPCKNDSYTPVFTPTGREAERYHRQQGETRTCRTLSVQIAPPCLGRCCLELTADGRWLQTMMSQSHAFVLAVPTLLLVPNPSEHLGGHRSRLSRHALLRRRRVEREDRLKAWRVLLQSQQRLRSNVRRGAVRFQEVQRSLFV